MLVEHTLFQNFPAIRLKTTRGDEALISLYGGQVLSWSPAGQSECLYLSEQAFFKHGTAIRGGIPVCFPQFSRLGELPMHGFVRNQLWRHFATMGLEDETGNEHDTTLTMKLTETKESLALWPHHFCALLSVSLGIGTLSITLDIQNTGTSPFSFTTALHSYFRVQDITTVLIKGLAKCVYDDQVTKEPSLLETNGTLIIDREIDRIYRNTVHKPVHVQTPERLLSIVGVNMRDTVIWNPWIERSQALPDMPDDGYLSMVCVESGSIKTPVFLDPGKRWSGGQKIELIKLLDP